MTNNEVGDVVIGILANQSGKSETEITDDKGLSKKFNGDNLGFDSLDLAEATTAAERELGVEIPNNDMEGCNTVGQFIQLCQEKFDQTG